jgi:hypothetical protein
MARTGRDGEPRAGCWRLTAVRPRRLIGLGAVVACALVAAVLFDLLQRHLGTPPFDCPLRPEPPPIHCTHPGYFSGPVRWRVTGIGALLGAGTGLVASSLIAPTRRRR